MSLPLSSHVAVDKNAVAASDPYVWLYEIEVPTDPATRYRLVRRNQSLSFRGHTYSPAPLAHAPTTESIDADLPTASITLPNISREISVILEAHNGLIGQRVRIMLVSVADSPTGTPITEQDFTIADVSVNEKSVTLRLRLFNAYRIKIPGGRLSRLSCRFKYRGPRCGYGLSEADGGLASCSKDFDGPNGCEAHGDSYTTAGITPVHPQRFGGERGIPRQQQGGDL